MIINVNLKLPYVNNIKGVWDVKECETQAAWETYIEIVTRILPVNPATHTRRPELELVSIRELFDKIRDILKKFGPSTGQTNLAGGLTFAFLALTIMNVVLRPVLMDHKLTSGEESRKALDKSPEENTQICEQLNTTYAVLIDFCNILTQAAGVEL
ncbi:MAG: hypothetical protein WC450_12670 [Candidatus Omnitrophota bacterium]|jgi:hypothetical protein